MPDALRDLARQGYRPQTMLDIGAHVGSFARDFLAIWPDCVPTLVEPNPYCQEDLARLPFERHAVAASSEAGVAEMFLTKEWLQSTGSSLYREDTAFFRDEVVLKVEVPKARLDDLLAGRRFDFVKIDTQGSELDVLVGGEKVLAQADYILVEVSMVEYNLGGATAEAVFEQLAKMGFHCADVAGFHRLRGVRDGALLQMDFLFARRARTVLGLHTAPMLAIAQALQAEGRGAEALTILDHLAALDPTDAPAQRARIVALNAAGRPLDALLGLVALRDAETDTETLLADIRDLSLPAMERFNAHLQAGEFAQAEPYAAAFAALAPQATPMQAAALVCNQALGRADQVARYARALLAIDPGDAMALKALADLGQGPADPVAQRMAAALSPPPGTHPLLQLRDLHDAASEILCGALDATAESRIATLLDAARALAIEVPPDSEWAGWETHYRLLLDAVDLEGVREATPPAAPEPRLEAVSATGKLMTRADLKAQADRLGAQAVFFAAADSAYVDLYARWYALSVLKHADVASLVVIHVIGGAGSLAEIAASVGVSDPRLVFTADAFDPATVTTEAYDAPPKGRAEKPIAHYQSVRFQRLGGLLEMLGRPVFVSDIDLLLQRGVADLLARTAADDVVFNENEISANAGSRLTANLLLVRPTANAQLMLRYLAHYLANHLARPQVTRWIDQAGLLFARHHLVRHGESPRIGYFDTASDINNVMYPTYQDHPFRFLSLFHGFDTASLEALDLGQDAAAAKPARRANRRRA